MLTLLEHWRLNPTSRLALQSDCALPRAELKIAAFAFRAHCAGFWLSRRVWPGTNALSGVCVCVSVCVCVCECVCVFGGELRYTTPYVLLSIPASHLQTKHSRLQGLRVANATKPRGEPKKDNGPEGTVLVMPNAF